MKVQSSIALQRLRTRLPLRYKSRRGARVRSNPVHVVTLDFRQRLLTRNRAVEEDCYDTMERSNIILQTCLIVNPSRFERLGFHIECLHNLCSAVTLPSVVGCCIICYTTAAGLQFQFSAAEPRGRGRNRPGTQRRFVQKDDRDGSRCVRGRLTMRSLEVLCQ